MNRSEVGIPTPEVRTRRVTPIPGVIGELSEIAISIDINLSKLEERSQPYNPRYIAFESLRRGPRQPFFTNSLATGFEGYWVGYTDDPLEVMTDLLDIGQAAFKESAKNGVDPKSLVHVLKGHVIDARVMHLSEQLFLAIRDSALQITQASATEREAFRKATHDSINPTTHNLHYIKQSSVVKPTILRPYHQEILLPAIKAPKQMNRLSEPYCYDNSGKIVKLDTYDQAVLDFLQTIGVVGHPLLRTMINNGLYDELAIIKQSRNRDPKFHRGKPKKLSADWPSEGYF